MGNRLAYKDRFLRVDESSITSDTTGAILAPVLPDDEPTKLIAEWTGKQFTKLFSALWTGATLMFPEERGEIVWQLLKVVHQPITLEEEDDDCINYLPNAPFVSYDPQNPYNQPDFVPEGYVVAPFHYNSDFLYPEIFGFLATDVMVATDAIPIFGDWGDVLGLHFPTIKLTVRGQGQIELDLLSIQLGGYAIVKVGSPPNIFDIADGIIETGVVIIDLQADVESIPIESDLVISEEINIDAIDGTEVYIVFVPKISASLDFFGMGGGIRQIGLCGLEEMGEIMGLEDMRFNTENCTFEKRVGGVWSAIEGGDDWLACVEALMATQEEIREAIIDASEEIAARFLSGQAGNVQGGITISPDGTVEVTEEGLPADDPATFYDETEAAIYGGTVSLVNALKLFYDKIDNYYGPVNGAPINAASFTKYQIKLYFPCDATTMDTAIDDYYAYRATNGRHVFTPVAATYQHIYCGGSNEAAWGRWISDNPLGYPVAKYTQMQLLSTGLAEAFWTEFFEAGLDVQNLNYLDAACVPNQPETMILAVLGTAYTSATTWKANHRLRLTITGYFSDTTDTPVNDIRDFWWYKQGSTGQLFFQAANNNMQLGSGITKPSSNIVPYTTANNHKYVCTIDTTGGAGQLQITIPATSMTTPVTTTGGFTVLIEDLGAI